MGHKAYEFPKNLHIEGWHETKGQGIDKTGYRTCSTIGNSPYDTNPERCRILTTRKTLLQLSQQEEKEVTYRKFLFRTIIKIRDRCCYLIVDIGNTKNIVSIKFLYKLGLECWTHSNTYKLSWILKGHHVTVSSQCLINFKVGNLYDSVLCDVISMDSCHLLFGQPCKYDQNMFYDG